MKTQKIGRSVFVSPEDNEEITLLKRCLLLVEEPGKTVAEKHWFEGMAQVKLATQFKLSRQRINQILKSTYSKVKRLMKAIDTPVQVAIQQERETRKKNSGEFFANPVKLSTCHCCGFSYANASKHSC